MEFSNIESPRQSTPNRYIVPLLNEANAQMLQNRNGDNTEKKKKHYWDGIELSNTTNKSNDTKNSLNLLNRAPQFMSPGLRQCFICLEGPSEEISDSSSSSSSSPPLLENSTTEKQQRELVSCCSQCFTVVHQDCWEQWRRNQKLSTLRAHLLGQVCPDVLACTVCKTGSARMEKEQFDISHWTSPGHTARRDELHDELFRILGRMLTENENDDDDEEPPFCNALVSFCNVGLFSVMIVIDLLCVLTFHFYIGDVLLWTILAGYYICVFQLLLLSLYQRRESLGPLLERFEPNTYSVILSQDPTNSNATAAAAADAAVIV